LTVDAAVFGLEGLVKRGFADFHVRDSPSQEAIGAASGEPPMLTLWLIKRRAMIEARKGS